MVAGCGSMGVQAYCILHGQGACHTPRRTRRTWIREEPGAACATAHAQMVASSAARHDRRTMRFMKLLAAALLLLHHYRVPAPPPAAFSILIRGCGWREQDGGRTRTRLAATGRADRLQGKSEADCLYAELHSSSSLLRGYQHEQVGDASLGQGRTVVG